MKQENELILESLYLRRNALSDQLSQVDELISKFEKPTPKVVTKPSPKRRRRQRNGSVAQKIRTLLRENGGMSVNELSTHLFGSDFTEQQKRSISNSLYNNKNLFRGIGNGFYEYRGRSSQTV